LVIVMLAPLPLVVEATPTCSVPVLSVVPLL
jgi:hypothetical protein